MRTAKSQSNGRGFTLPELLVSATIFGLVVVGSTASALLLAKIAADHENRADFSTDIRVGMEQMAFDVRNADSVKLRNNGRFVLANADEGDITYVYRSAEKKVIRRQGGSPNQDIFTNIKTFDVLTSAGDAPAGMTFDAGEIAIETLEFESSNGTGHATDQLIQQFTLKLRKG